MKEKIILISMSPYEELIANTHYFKKDFEAKGHIFEYWSIADIVGYRYAKNNNSFTRYFKSIETIVDALNKEKKSFYCNIQISLIPKLFPIFEAVEKNAIKFYELNYLLGSTSVMYNHSSESSYKKLKNYFNFKNLNNRIKQKIFIERYKRSKVSKNMIVFKPPGVNALPKLEVHHFDYEINNILSKSNINNNYFLFIDQAVPSHPETRLRGFKYLNKDLYLTEMNHFFDFLEKEFKTKIIIAAHPKATYNKEDFKDRSIIKYKTAELSKGARAIFTHSSTSFNYAILNNKPIVLLTMDEFFNKTNGTNLFDSVLISQNISSLLNAPIININRDLEKLDKNIFNIDLEKYEQFKNQYLISKANKNLSNFEIVYNYLFSQSTV